MFHKYPGNPILIPQGDGWESQALFNPAAWTDGNQVYLLYRAEGPYDNHERSFTSRIGLAISSDGISFSRLPTEILGPTESYDVPGGCEDPRIVRIGNRFYMTYTAYDGQTARVALAVSSDLKTWDKWGPLFPERGWTKSAAILAQPINGRYWMYFGDTNLWAAYSKDLERWTVIDEPVLSPRKDYFDNKLVEPGPPPIVTPQGILLIYNSADQQLRYAVGQCLFALDTPQRLIQRSDRPLLEPETAEEIAGRVPQVVFAEGLVRFKGRWLLYYGMADTRIGIAMAELNSIGFRNSGS
jgi:beta-1,2-mannosidase